MSGIKPLSPFEQRVRAIMRATGEGSLSALGKACGLSHATIGKWVESSYGEKFSPSAPELKKLADFAGVTIDWLLSSGPFDEVPDYEPTQGDLAAIRTRLLKRSYPEDQVNEVLLGTDFSGATGPDDLFDFAERELAARGFSAKFNRPALGVREVTEDEEGLPKPRRKGRST